MPDIDGMLQCSYVARHIVMVAGRRINRNDLVNGDQAPLCDIEIANEFKPGFKALLPGVEFGISTINIVAGILGHATHIAERKRYASHARRTKCAFMHEESQGISRV